jgi:hypothetical protein
MENGEILLALITFAAFWARIEHRLTVIETQCKTCWKEKL